MWNNLQKDKLEGKPVQNHLDNLSNWTFTHLFATLGGTATSTSGLKDPDNTGPLNATSGAFYLFNLVFSCLGMTPTTLPAVPAGIDASFEFIEPLSTKDVTSAAGDAKVVKPGQALDENQGRSVVALARQNKDDPNAGKVNTPFPKLSETFDVAFAGGKVKAGSLVQVLICTFENVSESDLKYQRAVIAHQKPDGNVEYLARNDGPNFCQDAVSSTAWRMEKGFFRQRTMQLAGLFKRALDFAGPRKAYAGHAAIGGSSCCFSPVVVIDPYVETEVVFTNAAGTALTPVDGQIVLPTTPTYGEPMPVHARLRIRNIEANPAPYRGQWVSPDAVTGEVNRTRTEPPLNLAMKATVDASMLSAITNDASLAEWSFRCVQAGGRVAIVNFSETPVRANAPLYGASSARANFTVRQRQLTVTANNYDKWIYGNDQNGALTAQITPTGPTGVQTGCGDAGTAVASSDKNGTTDAGSYPDAIRARIDFTPTATASNYNVQEVTANLTIQPRPINLNIVQPISRQYGDPNEAALTAASAASGYDAAQIRNSDVLTFNLAAPASAGPLALAGSSHSIAVTKGGVKIANYSVTVVPADPQLTITKRILTGAANPGGREYGDANPTFGGTVNNTGLCCLATDGLTWTWQSAATSLTAAGVYGPESPNAIQIVLGGGPEANYDASAVTRATLTITQAPLDIAANSLSLPYGSTYSSNTLTGSVIFGVKNSETIAVLARTTPPVGELSPVGTYALSPFLAASWPNYYVRRFTNGTLTITQRALTGLIADATKTEGQPNPSFDGTVNGLVAGDAYVKAFRTIPAAPMTVGTYPITLDLSGAGGSNYTWAGTDGRLTVSGIPNPVIVFERTETSGGVDRHHLDVTNRASYPASMFALAPTLPSCAGAGGPASPRSWVDIYNASTNAYIYGFCALGSPEDLNGIWFGVPAGTPAPPVYIKIIDRATGIAYTSNTITIPAP